MTWADFVVRGTLVLAAGFAASFAFGRASAALRHFVWTAAFLALLALPVALGLGPKIAVDAWPARRRARGGPPRRWPPSRPLPRRRYRVVPSGSAPPRPRAWDAYALALYLAGLLLVAARFLAGAVRTARMVRQARPAAYAQAVADAFAAPGIGAGCARWKATVRPCP
jgi:hypothetical protein